MGATIPRLLIAGLSGDSGKTVASLSLLTACRQKGLAISVFKKGPDYIDAAWLSAAAGTVCRNLDTYLTSPADAVNRFVHSTESADIAVIEGNRGIYDGLDLSGTHSTASLAKLLGTPVVLVIDTTKSTRTLAALVCGCLSFDKDVEIAGVILNRVAGPRHERIVTDSIEKYCQKPVLGAIPKLGEDASIIPGRHLGLVTPAEFDAKAALDKKLMDIADKYLNVNRLLELAQSARPLHATRPDRPSTRRRNVKIAYFKDSVFTFYYPENLEALAAEGAALVPVSSLDHGSLPADVCALYIGGGFPESQAARLTGNRSMMTSVKTAAEAGMPIYAECGGLIYLARSLSLQTETYPMAGVFPLDLKMGAKPAGHGYTEMTVERANPFFELGTVIKGHEFHYSEITGNPAMDSCMELRRGVGLGHGRDGLVHKSTLAGYCHIHADGVRAWAPAVVAAAVKYQASRSTDSGAGSAESADNGDNSPPGDNHQSNTKLMVQSKSMARKQRRQMEVIQEL